MTMRRKGFTALELLIVIGIIVLLAGLVIWGLSAAGGSGAANATRVTLQNLSNMLEELNRKNKLVGFDIVYQPPTPPGATESIEIAPGLVTDASTGTDRRRPAVQRTAEVIRRLMALPDNKKAIEKFPSDQLMPVAMTNSPPPATDTPGTVVLDGWHNPIVFVPSGGLKGVCSKLADTASAGTNYKPGARVIYGGEFWTALKSTSSVPSSSAEWFEGIRSPDGRPFWASAGPDGAFGAAITGDPSATPPMGPGGSGDDNIYSFEQ